MSQGGSEEKIWGGRIDEMEVGRIEAVRENWKSRGLVEPARGGDGRKGVCTDKK